MDVLLEYADEYLFDRVYASLLPLAPRASALAVTLASNGTAVNGTLAAAAVASTPAPSTLAHLAPILSGAKDAGAPLLASKLARAGAGAAPLLSAWPRDYIPRQFISLTLITLVGIHVLYFLFAWASYVFIFNHDMMKHPRYLKNQVRQEIMSSLRAFPVMTLLTVPWFLGEVRGYSMMYTRVDEYGWTWFFASIAAFLLVTDYCIYWIHRWEHHPAVYKYIHKPHHKWIIPTPFASHAFHPLDGYAQSLPYHAIVYVLPFHRYLFLGLFVGVNFWSILIHDSDLITGHPLEKIINGPAHHTLHHIYFTVNYGQYFTWADRAGGSYRQPQSSDDPMLEVEVIKAKEAAKKKQ